MRLNSIRTRTLLALILICTAIVFILGGVWLYTMSQSIKTTVSTADLHDSELMAKYIRAYVDSVEAPESLAASDPGLKRALREKNATLAKAVIEGLVRSTPHETVALVLDRNGSPVYSSCSTSGSMGSSDPAVKINISKNMNYVTGIFYSDELKGPAFAVVNLVRDDDGSIIGYIFDEVRPLDLYSFMMSEKKDMIHHVILVDGDGRVMLSDNRPEMEMHADLSDYPPVKKALSGESGIIEHGDLDGAGPSSISAYYPIQGVGWGIVLSTHTDIVYQPLRSRLFQLIGACTIFVAVLVIIGYFSTRYLIDPLDQLSGIMRKVSSGNYNVSIPVTRNDEIGDLERAFNALVAEIRKRDEVIRSERDRSEFFLDLMSHDINNMNHMGMGYLELALDRLKGRISPEDSALIEKAYDSLKSSSILITNVRNIKEVQTEQHRLETFNLCQMLQELAKKYAHYHGRDIEISYTPLASGCNIRAHRLFQEALSNIIENSIKHSDPARPLAIVMALDRVTEKDREYCRISIEDNGPGIHDDLKKTIFSRSQRGETRTGGKGLGLYIVKILVEEFGGRVWAEDSVAGDHTKGARFVILMPKAK